MNINVEQYLKLQDLQNMKEFLSEEEFTLRCLMIIYNVLDENELYNINVDENELKELANILSFTFEDDNIILDNVKINKKILYFTDCKKLKNDKYFTIKQYYSDIEDNTMKFLLTLSVLICEKDIEYSHDYFVNNINLIKQIDIRYALKQYQDFLELENSIYNNYKVLFEIDYSDKYRNRGYLIPDNFNVVATLDRLCQGDITKLDEVNNMSVTSTFAFLAYWSHKDKRISSINKMREKE